MKEIQIRYTDFNTKMPNKKNAPMTCLEALLWFLSEAMIYRLNIGIKIQISLLVLILTLRTCKPAVI